MMDRPSWVETSTWRCFDVDQPEFAGSILKASVSSIEYFGCGVGRRKHLDHKIRSALKVLVAGNLIPAGAGNERHIGLPIFEVGKRAKWHSHANFAGGARGLLQPAL